MRRVHAGQLNYGRERMGEPAGRIGDDTPVCRDEPAGVRPGGLGRHLLSQHHPDREFGFVNGSGNALPWRFGDERPKCRIGFKLVGNRFGIRVEIEQPPAAGDCG